MCNALVEELCLFVSDCLRAIKRENPLHFISFVFKSTCSGTLNTRAARKKIPVFVSKFFGEIVLNFLLCFIFFLHFFSSFITFLKNLFSKMWEG